MASLQASNGYATKYATLFDVKAGFFLISAKRAMNFSQGWEF
jgi:hypothetical protein